VSDASKPSSQVSRSSGGALLHCSTVRAISKLFWCGDSTTKIALGDVVRARKLPNADQL
jgi:hypothetical protein